MHGVVMENLEEYLSGALEPAETHRIEDHLSNCELCREEVRSMQETSLLFSSLRSEETLQPSLGFYAGIIRQVAETQPAPSVASLFGLDLVFARRLAFACLLTLAVMGSYLISRETSYTPGPSPEAILAQQDSPTFSSGPAQDNMLVTLTAYEH
jgi:anti-sigma factor RsiW